MQSVMPVVVRFEQIWNVQKKFKKKLIKSLQRFSRVYTWTDGRKDRMYMTSVFLQHFAVTRHTTNASFLGFMDLKECKYEIFRMIFRVGEVSFWQPFRYETDAGCDRDLHSSGAQTRFVGSSCQQVAFEISSSSPGAWWKLSPHLLCYDHFIFRHRN